MLKPSTVASQNHYTLHPALCTCFCYLKCVELQMLHISVCHVFMCVRTLHFVWVIVSVNSCGHDAVETHSHLIVMYFPGLYHVSVDNISSVAVV